MIFTHTSAATSDVSVREFNRYRAMSPPLIRYNDCTIEIGIEENTNELYLLKCGPNYYDVSGNVSRIATRIGKVSIQETVAGDGLIVIANKWVIRLTRLKDGDHLSEVSFPIHRHMAQTAALSPNTPFRREGHAEYDKLAVIFENTPTQSTPEVTQASPPHDTQNNL